MGFILIIKSHNNQVSKNDLLRLWNENILYSRIILWIFK